MSDNPMYWPGPQRPAWHQQPAPPGQPPTIGHYSTGPMGPNPMLANPMAMSGDPNSLQMQSSIPGRHQASAAAAAAALSSQHPASTLPPPGAQSAMYPGSMMPPQIGGQSVRPAQQLTPNSHLNSSNTQGIPPPPHSSLAQQSSHPQSHYSHQYSPLATPYWAPPSMNTQSSMSAPTGPPDPTQGSVPTQPDGSYHAPNALPTDNRGSITSNSATTLQQTAPPFHSPKDLQTSTDHMMSYDRQRGSMTQQHPSAIMSQSVPSSSASNLSPTPGQLSMQGRLQSQSQLDSMNSMSQQPGSSWPSSYYPQPNQSPYSSVMNPYMPYGSSSAVSNHTSSINQQNPRPSMGQKPSTTGSDRARASGYPPHGASIYGQPPPPPPGSSNGGYYGYDPYYNQMTNQTTSDPYLQHPGSSNAVQQWPPSASSNQIISNSSATGPIQSSIRPLTGPNSTNIHPQSPSTSTQLPTMSSRPPPQSQTPDRSPAPQHSTSYPSPNQQSSSKPTSNSLAQLEQMVMPGSGTGALTAIKSPSHRSTTASPNSQQQQQQQQQYSYNSSGQGSYFSTGTSAASNQTSYYPQYEQTSSEMPKSSWNDQMSGPVMNSAGPQASSVMMEGSQVPYSQPPYEGSSSYGEYATLSTPNNDQPRYSMPDDGSEQHQSDKGDPYAIDSQTFDDYDDQSSTSKSKKGRAKKGEEKVKKERKPRAPRAAPKAGPSNPQPNSSDTLQMLQIKPPTLSQTPEMSPAPQHTPTSSFPSPNQQSSSAIKPSPDTVLPADPMLTSPNAVSQPIQQQKPQPTPTQLQPPPTQTQLQPPPTQTQPPAPQQQPQLSAQPTSQMSQQQQQQPQQQQYSYNSSGQGSYFSSGASATPNQTSYYPQYEQTSSEMPKPSWNDQMSRPAINSAGPQASSVMMEGSQVPYSQPPYEGSSSYGEYATLSTPNNDQPRYSMPEETKEQQQPDKLDSHIGDTQPLEEQDNQSSTPKTKKRVRKAKEKVKKTKEGDEKVAESEDKPKKGDEKVKKERKPRASRASKSKAGSSGVQPSSTDASGSLLPLSSQTPDLGSSQHGQSNSYPSPSQTTSDTVVPIDPMTGASASSDKTLEISQSIKLDENSEQPTSQPPTESTPVEAKPKRIRIRDSSSKGKKKLPKFALKFAKTKKRKRLGSSDNDQSDLDKTPPPSPDEVESGVQKRRSARNTKKLKYNDDIELGFSESDDETQMLPKKKVITNVSQDGDSTVLEDSVVIDEPTVYAAPVEDTMVVEKIMSSRIGRRELEPEPGEVLPPDGTHIDVEEFYVKYKNLSYLHCDWRTAEELEKGDRRVIQKIKRYKQKKDSSNMFSFMDEEPFDPQYCEVDRILAVNEVEEMIPDDEVEKTDKVDEKIDSTTTEDSKTEPMQIEPNSVKESKEETDRKLEAAENVEEKDGETDKDNESDKLVPAVVVNDDVDKSKNESANEKIEKSNLVDPKVANLEDTAVKANDAEKSQDMKSTEASQEVTQQVEEKPMKMKKKISRHYLVKWRGLSYEESTWELEDDLDPEKIKHFMRFKDPPPKSKWRQVKRPKPEEWVRKEVSPVYKNNNTLREYQLEGINWLSFCWHQGRNCILADEMGLGKTIQSIAFVNEIYQHGINGPFLIIVPLSTVGNWAREFETWTDLNVITYHGSSTSREMLKEYEMFYRNEQGNRITNYYKFQVMITTFEIILSDCLDLREIPWKCCIIDEAHRLKNRNCKLLEGLRLLNMEHRVLLTGTPLQNNVEELFSLLNFLEPTQFSSTEQFLQEFGDLKTEAQVDKLKVILKPMMLRRLKEDVEKSLAPKEETIVEVELTNIQKKYYRAILEKNFSFLTKGSSSNNMPNLMNTMMELRKCCIHPYLINGAEEQIIYEAKQAKLAGGEPLSSFQAMVNSSGKLVLIDKLLPRLRADGHRVLIFSQMVRCLDILEDYVTHKHYPFERIDGRVRGSERQQAIDRFSKPGSDRFVFLLCTRAGGLGINLTAADTVIIFDSDWNPQNDLQAQARCHRIGQSKAVKIYRLICRNTYEREMFDKASLKLGLDKAVLQSMNTQKGGTGGLDGQLTKKEIEELLRKGAYGALMDDDNAGDKFCEEDIDQILQRRTQVITIDNSEAKGSTFSKATFSSSNNREDIELDDPNFWEKWAKKANIDSDELRSKDELIQLAPRRRTQTKRYGADGHLLDISDLESSEEDEETISMRTRGSRSGRQPKLTPTSMSKRSKRHREYDDEDFLSGLDSGYWSKSDCLKVEKGLLTYGWGRWEEIISNNRYKRDLSVEDCENICRVILLYCLQSYKGDEKIKSSAWELIAPPEEVNRSQSDSESGFPSRRKPKSIPTLGKKTVAEEIVDAQWTREVKYDPLIALPDDQYRRHLQRNCNRLLIRVKFLHYLKNDILKGYTEKILADCKVDEVDLPSVPVDGEQPAIWWDDEADKSLLVGIFKHGHDRFNMMRQDPKLCFLQRCGPPNKEELQAEMNFNDKSVEDLDDENRDHCSRAPLRLVKGLDPHAGEFLETLIDDVAKDLIVVKDEDTDDAVDENKNSIMKCPESQDSADDTCEVNETSQTIKMDVTDEESLTNETSAETGFREQDLPLDLNTNGYLPFPSANDLNQRFRRLITAYQRNSKKLEIKLAQKARDELKKERTSKFEAARNEREERKRCLAQKWSRREEADFFRAISSFGVEYNPKSRKHDWNKFRSIGKLDKKLDETLEDYYKAFLIMCKKATSRPLTADEEKCPINVDTITEERASRCLARIDFLNKIREQIVTHPRLNDLLKLCHPQSDLPDWWENGKHDKDLLIAAAKHGMTRLDYNLAHDPSLSFDEFIRQKSEQLFSQAPAPILIPIEQLQDLLEKNGIEYLHDLDSHSYKDDVKLVIDSILDQLDLEEINQDGYRSFADLVDGPHSRMIEESGEKSLLMLSKTPTKTTRSSTISSFKTRTLPNILSRRSANTIVKASESNGVRLSSLDPILSSDDRRIVEIIPILPDTIPEEPVKSFEAGELSLTIQSESALLQMDDRPPIVLLGAKNPITVRIRWPKDRAIQTRLENLVYLVERNEWPSPPKPTIPTITLPNHLASMGQSGPLLVSTSSPSKNDKSEMSLGSPKSDISNMSSRASKQDLIDRCDESGSRDRRVRGRRLRQQDEPESPNDNRQAAAKLRNLLSQGPTRAMGSSSGDKLTAKFGNNKAGAGLSSLLASFKQKTRSGMDLGNSRRDKKSLLDPNSNGAANLIPQILANMKPEFRDLLSNQDAATMLLNSLSGITGAGGIGTSLRSNANTQASLENLMNLPRSTKGPPPAHQRSDNSQQAHGGSSNRELRRNSQNTRSGSPPSVNLRSTRGKGSSSILDTAPPLKQADSPLGKSVSRKRGRPSSSSSNFSPSGAPGADVLDLSSLVGNKTSPSSRPESRSRRLRDHNEDSQTPRSSVSSKHGGKTGSKHSNQDSPPSPERGGRTTRASKRIGSRIDALALNLQAKRMHRGDSPTNLSPSLPKDKPMIAHGSMKSSSDSKSQSAKAPPAAHSGSNKSNASGSSIDQQRDKSNQLLSSNTSSKTPTSTSQRQDPLAQFMSNPASLLAGLNTSSLGGAGDLMNQLLRKAGTNDIVKNVLNEFIKNPSLALDPNILGTLTAGMPMNTSGLPNFNLPTTTVTPTPTKTSSASLLNDFKSPAGGSGSSSSSNNNLNKRSLGPLGFSNMTDLMKQMGNFPGLAGALPRVSGAPIVSNPQPTSRSSSSSSRDKSSRRSRQSTANSAPQTSTVSSQQAANAALANSLMSLASQPGAASNPYSNYTNPLANPFLPFGLANLGMNNPLGMGLFPNLYMPGFPTTDQQQSQQQQPQQQQQQQQQQQRSPRKDF